MAGTARILNRLAEEGKIAADWPSGLRDVDARIDAKIEASLMKVAALGPYLPPG
jgi:hypothetical protein